MRWMQFESTRTMHMDAAVQHLVRFNARRKDNDIPCKDCTGIWIGGSTYELYRILRRNTDYF